MMKEIIYITHYGEENIKEDMLDEYNSRCIICNRKDKIELQTILSQKTYPELSYERWNNIPLCKYCT